MLAQWRAVMKWRDSALCKQKGKANVLFVFIFSVELLL
jgi:hypothetical protein